MYIKQILLICKYQYVVKACGSQDCQVVLKIQKRHLNELYSTKKEYVSRSLIGYSSEQIFTVVSDVKNYKKFLPFCKKSDIIAETPGFMQANLEIGYPPIIEAYTSTVTYVKPTFIRAVSAEGRIFKKLENLWKFSPGLKHNPRSCIIDFSVSFEFKSVIHSQLASMFFDKIVKQMEWAFLLEARKRFGRESLPSHPLVFVKS